MTIIINLLGLILRLPFSSFEFVMSNKNMIDIMITRKATPSHIDSRSTNSVMNSYKRALGHNLSIIVWRTISYTY